MKNLIKIFILFISIISINNQVYAGIFDLFFPIKPPLKRQIEFNQSGLLVDEYFTVAKTCSYQLNFHLLHKEGKYKEYEHLYKDQKLPVKVTIKIFKVEEKKSFNILEKDSNPVLFGTALNSTGFTMGYIILDEGNYRVILESEVQNLNLAGIIVDFIIGVRPKTSCP